MGGGGGPSSTPLVADYVVHTDVDAPYVEASDATVLVDVQLSKVGSPLQLHATLSKEVWRCVARTPLRTGQGIRLAESHRETVRCTGPQTSTSGRDITELWGGGCIEMGGG